MKWFQFFLLSLLFYSCTKNEAPEQAEVFVDLTEGSGKWFIESFSTFNEEGEYEHNYRAAGTLTFKTNDIGEHIFLKDTIGFTWTLSGEGEQMNVLFNFDKTAPSSSPLVFYANPNYSTPVVNKYSVYQINETSLRFFFLKLGGGSADIVNNVELILTKD
jgi:hypothetical protein